MFTSLRAIRLHCRLCEGQSSEQVKNCLDLNCPVYPLRLGHAVYGQQPMRLIHAFCVQCQGGNIYAVRHCGGAKLLATGKACPFYPYRMGRKELPISCCGSQGHWAVRKARKWKIRPWVRGNYQTGKFSIKLPCRPQQLNGAGQGTFQAHRNGHCGHV